MSFKLGSFDTRTVEGFSAILKSMPSLPVDLSLGELPAGDGSTYYGSRMKAIEWEFSLQLRGRNVYDVISKADDISASINPNVHGLQDFTPLALDPWVWQGVVAAGVYWDRDDILWFEEGICQLNGEVTIVTPDPYGRAELAPVTRTGAGDIHIKNIGNAPYYPVLVIKGVSTDTQYIRVSNNGNVSEIFTALSSSEELVMDYETLSFYIRNATTKKALRSVADHFTKFHRFQLTGSTAINVSAAQASITTVSVTVSSRRI